MLPILLCYDIWNSANKELYAEVREYIIKKSLCIAFLIFLKQLNFERMSIMPVRYVDNRNKCNDKGIKVI